MEYFKKISVKTAPQTIIDCPVRIQEIAIIQDTVKKDILGRIIFANQSKENIIAVFFDLSVKDISGEPIALNDSCFIYQDMVVSSGELYGNKIAINLPDNARIFSADINKVVFENGDVWKASEAQNCTEFSLEEIVLPQKNLERIKEELIKIIPDVEHINYYYQENESAWLCSCGKVNFLSNTECSFCGCTKDSQAAVLEKKHFLSFCDNINSIVEKEKEEIRAEEARKAEEGKKRQEEENAKIEKEWQERKAEADRKKEIQLEIAKKKIARENRIVAAVVITILIVVIAACAFYFIRRNASEMARRNTYESAEEMMENLQGAYKGHTNGNAAYISIDGNILTRSNYSEHSGWYKNEYNILEWNFSKGTFATGPGQEYIVLSDGNIEDPDGSLFENLKGSSIDDAENG